VVDQDEGGAVLTVLGNLAAYIALTVAGPRIRLA
jgi:hypothetical protein